MCCLCAVSNEFWGGKDPGSISPHSEHNVIKGCGCDPECDVFTKWEMRVYRGHISHTASPLHGFPFKNHNDVWEMKTRWPTLHWTCNSITVINALRQQNESKNNGTSVCWSTERGLFCLHDGNKRLKDEHQLFLCPTEKGHGTTAVLYSIYLLLPSPVHRNTTSILLQIL